MASERRFFVAGKFGAPQGVKGLVRVISLMEDPEAIFDTDNWYIPSQPYGMIAPQDARVICRGIDADTEMARSAKAPEVLELLAAFPTYWQEHPKGFAVSLPGVQNRDQAQMLTHQLIYLPLDILQPLEDEYYWRDLIGLSVIDADDQPQGVISEILETGANDVLVVSGQDKPRVLVPYIPEQVILSVDLDSKVIRLDWDFSSESDEEPGSE